MRQIGVRAMIDINWIPWTLPLILKTFEKDS